MNKEPNRNVYVGHRYVPLFLGQWTRTKEYEGLSIVSYKGDSYTSRKRVPVGVDITNEEYWAVTGNYNAQIEEYRKETLHIKRQLDDKPSNLEFSNYKTATDKKINSNKSDTDKQITANKSDTDKQINDNKKDTDNKITTVTNELDNKISKGNVRVSDIDINQGKITQNYISDTLLSQIAGDSAVNAVPGDYSITNVKLANESVGNRALGDDSVWGRNILDKTVTEDHLKNGAVGTSQLKDYSVVGQKIGSKEVGNRAIGDQAVWSNNILDNTITNKQLNTRVYGHQLEGLTLLNDVVTPGIYTQPVSQNALESLAFPPGKNAGVLDVRDMGDGIITQVYTATRVGEVWTRRRYLGNWSEWQQVGHKNQVPLLNDDNLDKYDVSGNFKQVYSNPVTPKNNYPEINHNVKTGSLIVISSSGSVTQMYIADRSGEIFTRERTVSGTWLDWKSIVTSQSGSNGLSKPHTNMELTGKWTSNSNGDNFMLEMGKKENVKTIEVGQSVRGTPMYASIIGDETKPALFINAGAHGTEVGAPEGAWLLIREFSEIKNLLLMDMCIIILPNQNPDNRFIARGNKNAVDLNRDWLDRSQPETKAVEFILDNYNVVFAVDLHNFGYERETSLQGVTNGSEEVKQLSQNVYDTVFELLEKDEQPVRHYGPELPETAFNNGIATVNNIPTLLVEIPCGGYNDWTFDDYYPTPEWQAHIGITVGKGIANYLWKNLGDFYTEEV